MGVTIAIGFQIHDLQIISILTHHSLPILKGMAVICST